MKLRQKNLDILPTKLIQKHLPMPTAPKTLSINQAAKLLNKSTKTLRRWEASGKIIPRRTSGGHRRYNRAQVLAIKRRQTLHKQRPIAARVPVRPTLQPIPTARAHQILSTLNTPPESFRNRLPILIHSMRSSQKFLSVSALALLLLTLSTFVVNKSGLILSDTDGVSDIQTWIGASDDYPGLETYQQVLAAQVAARDYTFSINVPTNLTNTLSVAQAVSLDDTLTVAGTLTAPNVVYGITAGTGITVTGGQNPSVSNTGVLSVGGTTGAITLEAGDGIEVSGLKITNTRSAGATNTDDQTLAEVLAQGNATEGTDILFSTTDEANFRDTALKIFSSVDGQLDIDADSKVEITANNITRAEHNKMIRQTFCYILLRR